MYYMDKSTSLSLKNHCMSITRVPGNHNDKESKRIGVYDTLITDVLLGRITIFRY